MKFKVVNSTPSQHPWNREGHDHDALLQAVVDKLTNPTTVHVLETTEYTGETNIAGIFTTDAAATKMGQELETQCEKVQVTEWKVDE